MPPSKMFQTLLYPIFFSHYFPKQSLIIIISPFCLLLRRCPSLSEAWNHLISSCGWTSPRDGHLFILSIWKSYYIWTISFFKLFTGTQYLLPIWYLFILGEGTRDTNKKGPQDGLLDQKKKKKRCWATAIAAAATAVGAADVGCEGPWRWCHGEDSEPTSVISVGQRELVYTARWHSSAYGIPRISQLILLMYRRVQSRRAASWLRLRVRVRVCVWASEWDIPQRAKNKCDQMKLCRRG